MTAGDRVEYKGLVAEAVQNGARKEKAAFQLGVSVRTMERWETRLEDGRKGPNTQPTNALTQSERANVLSVANSLEFANLPPGQIVPLLADRGEYIASESSFYRILKEENCLSHRSKSRPKQHRKPEELVAMAPNQIWSWDITYLRTQVKGIFYYLYLPMDVFSRKIVYWEIHENESPELAGKMITKACELQGVESGQVKLHSDNGGPMKGATMLATLQRLGIAPSFSRPKVSNDNPYSESLFKTLKYCPSYPESGCFANVEAAKHWVSKFVAWYNHVHLHSGINWVTPAARHANQDEAILKKRKTVYEIARIKNPNRWSKDTRNWSRPTVVKLNPGRCPKNQSQENAVKVAS